MVIWITGILCISQSCCGGLHSGHWSKNAVNKTRPDYCMIIYPWMDFVLELMSCVNYIFKHNLNTTNINNAEPTHFNDFKVAHVPNASMEMIYYP